MAKPRTNAKAIEYWADSILENEPRAALDVNSIIVRDDVVFSFGSHYPMGVIQRAKSGKVTRVIVTSDNYPSRGFANTPGDQWNVTADARDRAAKRGVPIVRLPLSDYSDAGIRVRPSEDDPEPPAHSYIEVPGYFHATDPGPEPVKDPRGCIAGRVEEYEAQDERYVFPSDDVRPWDFTLWHRYGEHGESKSLYVRRAVMHRIEWGAARDAWSHYRGAVPDEATYKQCPHCAAFDKVHEAWYVLEHGPRWGRGHGKGFRLHRELMDRYGSEEAWRAARREDWRRVRRERTERAEWVERNFIPLGYITHRSDSYPGRRQRVPALDPDGYVLRKDVDAYFLGKRKAARAERRRQREHERQDRERRQLERFKRRIRSRRRPNIPALANETACALIELGEQIVAANANAQRQSEDGDTQ